MSIVSISMPEALLERIDTFADEHGYSGRSEVVREASRKLLEEIAGFVNTVRAIPNVRTVEYSILPLGAELSKEAVQ